MANIKVKFRRSSVDGKPGTVFYQISHRSKIKLISTNIHIQPSQWDFFSRGEHGSELLYVKEQIDNDIRAIRSIICSLEEQNKDVTINDITTSFGAGDAKAFVLAYIGSIVTNLRNSKRLGTAENFRKLSKSFSEYLRGKDILFTTLNESIILRYNDWLVERGLCRNSTSFYMRNLRTVYRRAVKMQLLKDSNPFKGVYTGIAKTKKRAITEPDLIKLSQLDLSYSKSLSFAKDMFLFSYCTLGMAYVDIAHLKRSNIHNGVIVYQRQKTKQRLVIKILPQILAIINKYTTQNEQYLFPIITSNDDVVARRQYQCSLIYYNRLLKRIASIIGGGIQLTSYTPRHTWATIARRHNVPLTVISEGMGHENEKTTQIYLDSIETDVVDEANKMLVDILVF